MGIIRKLREASAKVEQIFREELGDDRTVSPEFTDEVERFGGSKELIEKIHSKATDEDRRGGAR